MTTCNRVGHFFLHCDPIPAPRPRAVARGKFASVYHPADYTKWKEALVNEALNAQGIPEEPLAGALVVTIHTYVTPPKTTKLTHPGPDVDNYAKGVLDALTQSKAIWADDKQVVDLRITKRWCDLAQPDPGFEVLIQRA